MPSKIIIEWSENGERPSKRETEIESGNDVWAHQGVIEERYKKHGRGIGRIILPGAGLILEYTRFGWTKHKYTPQLDLFS